MPVELNINHLLANVLQYLQLEVSLNGNESLEEKKKFISNCKVLINHDWSDDFENSSLNDPFFLAIKPLLNNPKENYFNNPHLGESANTLTVIYTQHFLFKNIFEACRQDKRLLTEPGQIEWFEQTHEDLFKKLKAIKNNIPSLAYLMKRYEPVVNYFNNAQPLSLERNLVLTLTVVQVLKNLTSPGADIRLAIGFLQILLGMVTMTILMLGLLRESYANTFFKAGTYLNQIAIVNSDDIKKFFLVEAHELDAFKKEIEQTLNEQEQSIAFVP